MLDELRRHTEPDSAERPAQLDVLTSRVVQAGLATRSQAPQGPALIVRGRAQLLTDVSALEDLERIRSLFETLEEKESTLRLLDSTGVADGVQIFIGAENALFRHTGCSMIIAQIGRAHV